MSNCVDDLNNMPETKSEIKKRLASFEHIAENVFLCARRYYKQCMGMECDCEPKYVPKGSKGCGDNCLNRQLMMECPQTCSLGKLCSNKRFQNIENAQVSGGNKHYIMEISIFIVIGGDFQNGLQRRRFEDVG